MTRVVEIDPREITITPIFKMMEIENVPKSEVAGRAVMEMREMVEVRFAGAKNYAPCFPATAFSRREGNRVITYAERWPEQYRAFKEGNPQEANGTPLEMLRSYGVTPELISMCRALKIYSIESLHHLEGPGAKSLGMNANRLKEAARQFMADKLTGQDALSEIEALRAEIAAMKAGVVPAEQTPPEEIDKMVAEADAAFAALSDDEIKEKIALIAGSKPRGTPSRDTLERTLRELQEAA
jgi:hypothetical protein